MSEIGVERFGARHHEKDCTERYEPDQAVAQQEAHAVGRIESPYHGWVLADVPETGGRERDEPYETDRTEKCGNAGGAARLNCKQRNQDRDGQWDDVRFERRGHYLQAFDRRQDRQRGREDRVAVEQRTADDTKQNDGAPAARYRTLSERHEGQGAALAFVVRSQENEYVFDRDDYDQCPNDQRQNAQHDRLGHRIANTNRGLYGFAHRIERAGADVAVDDADAAERERPKAGFRSRFAVAVKRRCAPQRSRHNRRHGFQAGAKPAPMLRRNMRAGI